MTDALHTTLASALKRTVPYLDLLPPTAAAEVREALDAWEMAVAAEAIVQQPRERWHVLCPHCVCPFLDEASDD